MCCICYQSPRRRIGRVVHTGGGLVEGENVGRDALEEEEKTLEEDIPDQVGLEYASVVPEYL